MTEVVDKPATGAPPAAVVSGRRFAIDGRYLPPILITCILLAGQLSFGVLESYTRTLLAIVTSIALEIVLGRLVNKKWPHLASAYITGISVGILIRSPAFWPYALCSAISIVSKYALRLRGQHLWNPSNFGVSAIFFLAPAYVAGLSVQWGNNIWPMVVIWVLGSIIIGRLHRFHICLTYVLAFLVLALARCAITGQHWLTEVAPITGPMYQLFIFFMITDPRTTVKSKTGQCLTVLLVALVEAIMRLNQVIYAPFYALFLVGPAALLVEMFRAGRTPTPVSQPKFCVPGS